MIELNFRPKAEERYNREAIINWLAYLGLHFSRGLCYLCYAIFYCNEMVSKYIQECIESLVKKTEDKIKECKEVIEKTKSGNIQ